MCIRDRLKAQYTPAGEPSAPGTPADCVRTRTRPPSLVSSANSWTWRPGTCWADISLSCTSCASAARTAQPSNPLRPTASPADQPRIRSASRFQWVITPSESKAHSAASIPSNSAASRSSAVSSRPEALTWNPQQVFAYAARQIIELERDPHHTAFRQIDAALHPGQPHRDDHTFELSRPVRLHPTTRGA